MTSVSAMFKPSLAHGGMGERLLLLLIAGVAVVASALRRKKWRHRQLGKKSIHGGNFAFNAV